MIRGLGAIASYIFSSQICVACGRARGQREILDDSPPTKCTEFCGGIFVFLYVNHRVSVDCVCIERWWRQRDDRDDDDSTLRQPYGKQFENNLKSVCSVVTFINDLWFKLEKNKFNHEISIFLILPRHRSSSSTFAFTSITHPTEFYWLQFRSRAKYQIVNCRISSKRVDRKKREKKHLEVIRRIYVNKLWAPFAWMTLKHSTFVQTAQCNMCARQNHRATLNDSIKNDFVAMQWQRAYLRCLLQSNR